VTVDNDQNEITLKETTNTVRSIFKNISITDSKDNRVIKKTVNDMLRCVLKDRSVMMNLTEVRSADTYIFTHSVNVAMLSMIAGLFLKLKREQLKSLGIAALLHDIGRTKVPKKILYKPSPLSEEEFDAVKKHSQHGYKILKTCGQFDENVCLAVLQHHERLDGSGYPNGIKGDQIGVSARIIAIADVFDALLADRPFRKAFFPHQAIDIIINSHGLFDSEILKVFIENVAIYPLGSVVSLNTGEIGVVVDMNKGRRTRPVVRIMFDCNSQKLHIIKEVDLSKSPELFITKILREEQIIG
jgi:putative nucleotidyltransferase with HDIG domain